MRLHVLIPVRTEFEKLRGSASLFGRVSYAILRLISLVLPAYRREKIVTWVKRLVHYRPSYCRRVTESGVTDVARSPRVIVSLTSYPARIKTVHRVISALLHQTFKPDVVVLWLGEDRFPGKENDLPRELLRLREFGLTIGWTRDIRSYTKLIPALKKYPEDIIVTADDDTLYHPDALARLYASYLKDPEAVHCHACLRIAVNDQGQVEPYKSWKHVEKSGSKAFRHLLLGFSGVLYPPHVADAEIFNEKAFKSLAPFADDLWFWSMVVKAGNKILMVDDEEYPLSSELYADQANALSNVNVDGPARNDEQLAAILSNYPEVAERVYYSVD